MSGTRTLVDQNVLKFLPISETAVYVLGTDGKLWLEKAPFGNVPPARNLVDSDVSAWKPGANPPELFVLKGDASLWCYPTGFPAKATEGRSGTQIVDNDVLDFYPWDEDTLFILGTNGRLWQAKPPYGKTPPTRVPVD